MYPEVASMRHRAFRRAHGPHFGRGGRLMLIDARRSPTLVVLRDDPERNTRAHRRLDGVFGKFFPDDADDPPVSVLIDQSRETFGLERPRRTNDLDARILSDIPLDGSDDATISLPGRSRRQKHIDPAFVHELPLPYYISNHF